MKNFSYRDALRIANFISVFLLLIAVICGSLSFFENDSLQFDYLKFSRDAKMINDRLSYFQGKSFAYGDIYDTLTAIDNEFYADTIQVRPYDFLRKNGHLIMEDPKATDTVSFKMDTIPIAVLDGLKNLSDVKFKTNDSLVARIQSIAGKSLATEYGMSGYQKYSDVQQKWWKYTILFFIIAILFGISFPLGYIYDQRLRQYNQATKAATVNEELKNNPTDIKPAWEKAQLTLEQYYNRNLSQINMIFFVSVAVMVAGFILIGIGIIMAYTAQNGSTFVPIVSTCSGIITEFIGATFIIIYNSTIKQASTYTESLEKINSVGMSVTILNGIKVDSDNAQKVEDAKIEIAKSIIGTSPSPST
jgi:hypothetical protein